MVEAVFFKCSRCGAEMEWDFELGGVPLCVSCWDKDVESNFEVPKEDKKEKRAEYWSRYYEEHKEELKQKREANRQEINEYWRRYRAAHKPNLHAAGPLARLTPERRVEIARNAANVRWSKEMNCQSRTPKAMLFPP